MTAVPPSFVPRRPLRRRLRRAARRRGPGRRGARARSSAGSPSPSSTSGPTVSPTACSGAGVVAGDRVGLHLRNHAEHVEAMLGVFKAAGGAGERELPLHRRGAGLPGDRQRDGGAVHRARPGAGGPGGRPPRRPARPGDRRAGSGATTTLLGRAPRPRAPRVGRAHRRRPLPALHRRHHRRRPRASCGASTTSTWPASAAAGTPAAAYLRSAEPVEVVRRAVAGSPVLAARPAVPADARGRGRGSAWQSLLAGGAVIIDSDLHLDPAAALRLAEAAEADLVMVVGDAVARPLADALGAARAVDPAALPLPRLQLIASGGAILSPAVKDQLRALLPERRRSSTASGRRRPGARAASGPGPTAGRPASSATHATTVLAPRPRAAPVARCRPTARPWASSPSGATCPSATGATPSAPRPPSR